MARVFILLAFFILASLNATSAYSVCEDWLPFNEWCYKIVDNTTRTYDDSVTSCHQLDLEATLAVIHNKEEQDFLSNYLFKTMGMVDNAWIGAKFSNESKYKWIDNTDLAYTNWDARGARNKSNYCIQMQSDEALVGKWLDVSCERKNLVLCQKMQTWTFGHLQKEFLKERIQQKESQIHFEETKNQLVNLQSSYDELKQNFTKLQNIHAVMMNPIPIGFIYVQLPRQPEPKSLWPTLDWTIVSTDYAGHFFRVEGGNAVPFGQSQSDAFQGHNHEVELKELKTFANGSDRFAFSYSGTMTKNYAIANNFISDGTNGVPRIANETRPINYSVRIWKRVA